MTIRAVVGLLMSVRAAGWAGPTSRVHSMKRSVVMASPLLEAEPFVLEEVVSRHQELPPEFLSADGEAAEAVPADAAKKRNLKNSRRRPQPASMPVLVPSRSKGRRGSSKEGKTKLLSKEEEIELAAYVQRLAQWMGVRRELNETLGREPTEKEWAEAAGYEGDDFEVAREECSHAKETFVSANLPLVVSVAKRYRFLGSLDYADLLQEGTFGLTRAVERFDASRGYRFSTYAVWWIRQAISAAVADQSRVIRLPPKLHRDLANLEKARRNFESRVGREPSDRELAAALDLCATKVEFLKDCGRTTASPVSFDATRIHSRGGLLGDRIADSGTNPVDFAVSREVETHIAQLLRTALNPRECTVLSLSFGLADGRPRSLDQIATLLNKSSSAVRAIKAKALHKLRQPHSGNHILKAHYQHY